MALPYSCNNFKSDGWVRHFCHYLHYRRIISRVSDKIRYRKRLFPQKHFKFFKFEFNLHYCDIRVWNCLRGHMSITYPIWYTTISSYHDFIKLYCRIKLLKILLLLLSRWEQFLVYYGINVYLKWYAETIILLRHSHASQRSRSLTRLISSVGFFIIEEAKRAHYFC